MIDPWVNWPILLDADGYDQKHAEVMFRVVDEDLTWHSITIDGRVHSRDTIEGLIGEESMGVILKDAQAWWDDVGYHMWSEGAALKRGEDRYEREHE